MDDEAVRRAHLHARLEGALDDVALAVDRRSGAKAREVRAKVRSYRRVLAYWSAVIPTHAQERALEELVLQLRGSEKRLGDHVSGVRRLKSPEEPLWDERSRSAKK